MITTSRRLASQLATPISSQEEYASSRMYRLMRVIIQSKIERADWVQLVSYMMRDILLNIVNNTLEQFAKFFELYRIPNEEHPSLFRGIASKNFREIFAVEIGIDQNSEGVETFTFHPSRDQVQAAISNVFHDVRDLDIDFVLTSEGHRTSHCQ